MHHQHPIKTQLDLGVGDRRPAPLQFVTRKQNGVLVEDGGVSKRPKCRANGYVPGVMIQRMGQCKPGCQVSARGEGIAVVDGYSPGERGRFPGPAGRPMERRRIGVFYFRRASCVTQLTVTAWVAPRRTARSLRIAQPV